MKTRKEITLPSGGTLFIRPPSMFDMMDLGEMPSPPRRTTPPAPAAAPLTPAELSWHVRSTKMILRSCTGLIRWAGPPPRRARIVDKPFDECTAEEITIEDLADDDAAAILQAVSELRKEAAAAVKTFPQAEPAPGPDQPLPPGQTLAPTPDGNPAPH